MSARSTQAATGKYSKVTRKIWRSPDFQSLSPMPPSGQGLFLYLLTCPELTAIPGVILAGKAALAEALGWSPKAFEEAFDEGFRKGMAKADWKLRLVWLPNALRHNAPESPNVVRHWGKAFDELPECDLKVSIFQSVREFMEGLGQGFAKAFREAFREPSPNQEHEPEQEQEQEQKEEREAPVPARVSRVPATRLPSDWTPSPEVAAYCSEKLRMADPLACLEDFRDCFLAMADANKNSRKNDWGAAYRLWTRRAVSEGKVSLLAAAPPPPKPALGPLVEVPADMLASLAGTGIVNKSRTG